MVKPSDDLTHVEIVILPFVSYKIWNIPTV